MSDLERALRAAFARDAAASPGPGLEARMARAAQGRGGRMRAAPALLAAAVAGAAIATLALGRGREEPAPRVAIRPAAPAAGGSRSFTEVWELVIRFGRTFSVEDDEGEAREQEDTMPPPPERRRRHLAEPRVDCGDDPLCPLVAPHAGRLQIATSGTWARVSIDGLDAGVTPLDTELIPGRHRVSFRFADGRRRDEEIVLRPGERRTLLVSPPATR